MAEFFGGFLCAAILAAIVYQVRLKSKEESKPTKSGQIVPPSDNIYEISASFFPVYERTAHPKDLLYHPEFQRGAALMAHTPEVDLFAYSQGEDPVLACMALEAYLNRDQSESEEFLEDLMGLANKIFPWGRFFLMRILSKKIPPQVPLVGRFLPRLNSSWTARPSSQFLREFIQRRTEGGEKQTFGTGLDQLSNDQINKLEEILDDLGRTSVRSLLEELKQWKESRLDREFFTSVGKIWGEQDLDSNYVLDESQQQVLKKIETDLLKNPPRSVLVAGENGVGKTSIVKAVARKLQDQGWYFFEAGHTEIQAGQTYIGQLEDRLRLLFTNLSAQRPVIWYVPDFHALSWTGRHLSNPISILPRLLQAVELGQIRIIGETSLDALKHLLLTHPQCNSSFDIIRVEPLSPHKALQLTANWLRSLDSEQTPWMLETTLSEASHLAQQYLPIHASPGNLFNLLRLTRKRLTSEEGTVRTATRNDLIISLASLTGLPEELLDDRRKLDIQELRTLFDRRVLGQPEAVDCLVERVAMIKAGVNDPSRPLGVFLFAGPTGTGKTEIVKSLTEFLFGSPERMIRLDMSELQSPDALHRIIGYPSQGNEQGTIGPGGALVDQIRRQPFSVVLLDEFEKSHPQIWDLFLQVFDDGRLTDRQGRTADFRQAIIILTSNLGSAVPTGVRLGFTDEANSFSPGEIRQVIGKTFTKEFLNRLDRIVIFRPLGRETIRKILRKELDEAFKRRGLRDRDWALVWDNEALEFLIEKGFTIDMGARPLKRVIERYLLTPLSLTILEQKAPQGDQFLFVKVQNEELEVEFIDPDQESEAKTIDTEPVGETGTAGDLSPTAILLSPRGSMEEASCLQDFHNEIRNSLNSESWLERKRRLMDAMSLPEFWSSENRFQVLGEVEYLDRIQAGSETAQALLEKLISASRRKVSHLPRDLVSRLAQQVYLLQQASSVIEQELPLDVFLRVAANTELADLINKSNEFARRLYQMYESWARKRGMKFQLLYETPEETGDPLEIVAAVSGFGVYPILEREKGLHIWESPGKKQISSKTTVEVWIVSQGNRVPGNNLGHLCRYAQDLFPKKHPRDLAVVRRYREEPSPLVRDLVRPWRTGLLERVLDGDFDLF